jgi:hypothetical protein
MLALAGLLAALILAEVVLRAIRPPDLGSSFEYRVPHPVLGWVLEPGASYRNRMPEATVRVSYNAAGFRDVEHSVKDLAERLRVVVLGDSFMEGYSVELEESFHRRLGERLRDAGVAAETINLGVGGYGTLQQYLLYREVGRRYGPRLVLLGFYVDNDPRNNSLELESVLETRGLKAESRPFLEPGDADAWSVSQVDYEAARHRYAAAMRWREILRSRLTERSALLHAVARLIDRLAAREEGPSGAGEARPAPDDLLRHDLALRGVHYCEEPPELTRAWALTERILRRLKQDVERSGAALAVFSVPAVTDVVPAEMRRARAGMQDPGALCLEQSPGYRRLEAMLERLEIEFVDLLPEFRRAAAEEGAVLFRRGDLHWNARGHALAAERVAVELAARELW